MKLHLDSAKGYYSSRVGLNMYELTTGEYTVVFKLYFPSAAIDHSSVDISATSSSETASRTSTNLFSDHSRSRTELQHMPADLNMSNKINNQFSYTNK